MNNYIIPHPPRIRSEINDLVVYHDSFEGNQDPYLWNNKFLHSYCKITNMKNEEEQINFWVSADIHPNFNQLLCDCVFVVSEKHFWAERNNIERNDSIVDNDNAFDHHYNWAHQHPFTRRRRYTLKADSDRSFQPQTENRGLFDILPFLNANGIETNYLRQEMFPSWRSKYYKFDHELGERLYNHIFTESSIKLFGTDLEDIHP